MLIIFLFEECLVSIWFNHGQSGLPWTLFIFHECLLFIFSWGHHDLVASKAVFSLSQSLLLAKGSQVQTKEH